MPRVSSKDKYIVQVFELFKKKGLTLNMEQIAQALGLTKKTLFNNFTSKQVLIGTVVSHFYKKLESDINSAISSSDNAIFALMDVSSIIRESIMQLGSVFLKDISVYQSCPEVFDFMNRKNFYSKLIKENLERGITEGLYRKDLNKDYATLFYTSAIDSFYRWDGSFKHFNESTNYHNELVKYHLYSIVNENGLKFIESYLMK